MRLQEGRTNGSKIKKWSSGNALPRGFFQRRGRSELLAPLALVVRTLSLLCPPQYLGMEGGRGGRSIKSHCSLTHTK